MRVSCVYSLHRAMREMEGMPQCMGGEARQPEGRKWTVVELRGEGTEGEGEPSSCGWNRVAMAGTRRLGVCRGEAVGQSGGSRAEKSSL